MTPVKFEFYEPDGTPLANVTFEIRMAKSGFLELVNGIVMPDTIEATTDADGTVTVLLAPSSSLYYLSVANPNIDTDEPCGFGGIKYKFYVPDQPNPVRVQDLIMDPPPSTTAWDEAAMLIIVNAKAAAVSAAAEAKQSEIAAELALSQIGDNTERVEAAALAALTSRNEAAGFSNSARTDAEAVATDKVTVANYKNAAEQSAQSANASKLAAETAKDTAVVSATATSADRQAVAADKATVAADKGTVAADKAIVIANKNTVAADKAITLDARDQTKVYRDEALAALGSITGVISDGGPIDLSGGVYPPKPSISTMWRVTVPGTVNGIVFNIGDQLFYTKGQNLFYQLDGTENVHSVAGRVGDVVLAKSDVGLNLVDNTPDTQKPISNAAAAAFAARTPTTSTLDTTANRLIRVGDYGRNGGLAIPRISTDDVNHLTVSALYAFTAGGLNLPEPAYVDHMAGSVVGYAKQVAYGYATNKQYMRTQSAGGWGAWLPALSVVDSLSSTDATQALAARQGKILYDLMRVNTTSLHGLDWVVEVANFVNIESGTVFLPYAGQGRVVTVSAAALSIPTQPGGTDRCHLWVHDDDNDGVGTVVYNNTQTFVNYSGHSFTSQQNPGWRYIGTVLLNTARNPLNQRCIGNAVNFMAPAVAPLELIYIAASTSNQGVSTAAVVTPLVATGVWLTIAGSTTSLTRLSSNSSGSAATGGSFGIAVAPLSGNFYMAFGTDTGINFVSDSATGNVSIRCTGYTFKR